MLMATLKENQTSDITMSIGIDGDSMGKQLSNTAGGCSLNSAYSMMIPLYRNLPS